jgi:hypothetical protein
VSNPAKSALSYLLIDVYLTGHFPQIFIRYDSGPPDVHDISQAYVYKGQSNQPIMREKGKYFLREIRSAKAKAVPLHVVEALGREEV